MNEIKYVKMWPAGNTTALVLTNLPRIVYSEIACKIIQKDKTIEQVGFIEPPTKMGALARLQMMGGEFCGNATRSLALYLSNKIKKDTEFGLKNFYLEVSGTDRFVYSTVNENNNVEISMPVAHYGNVKNIVEPLPGGRLIKLDGIRHFVTDFPLFAKDSPNLLRLKAHQILRQERLLDFNAAGVIFVEKTEKGLKIHPLIWVRDTDTLIYETSCASGTLAVGINETLQLDDGTNEIGVLQPSGASLNIKIEKEAKHLKNAFISGAVLQKEMSSIYVSPQFAPAINMNSPFVFSPIS